MMKLAIVIILFAIISPNIVLAQTATSSPQTVRDRLKALREERKETIVDSREELKEKMATFRAQIITIKDERKQMLTDRISDRVASSNTRLTERMDRALDHLTDILNRVKTKAIDFKSQGKNTTALDEAIAAAENAIAAAQSAVDAQKLEEYTANITDETALRNTMGQMVSSFRQDVKAVHKLIVDAKQAVMKAIMEAAKLRGENKTATGSAHI